MSTKMVVLKNSNGESFEAEEAIVLQTQTIARLVEDDCANKGIPLENVRSHILEKMIEYREKEFQDLIKKWDAEIVKVNDQSTIFHLILAAKNLNIKSLFVPLLAKRLLI
ncbi:unnamed protein product [Microthlaspi erraticum]|uniref:SKP1 component POZ domain-containing protein n=1 Tax=Microthlaspi erraticum TaxID=1685480 RepID=A0A6D2IWJ2_9BRAS|nr:unnamed protein product [Microthlaspi erraticum]